jgi:PAS domain S-box-containing protein
MRDGAIICDADARVRDVNDAFCAMTGYGRAELIGCGPPYPFWPEGSAAGIAAGIATGSTFELTFRRKDGTRFPVGVTASPVPGDDGRPGGQVAVVRDLTAQREAEQRLLRGQQLVADFVENGTVGMHWVGPDGTILWANKAELDLLEYSTEEYVGRHIGEFHADRPVIDDILCRLSNNQTLHEYEARPRCKDGSIRHVLINSSVLCEEGKFVHTRCFTRDVTDRKRAEEALREGERRLASIIHNTPAQVFITDLQGRYVLERFSDQCTR